MSVEPILYQNQLVDQILAELEAEIAQVELDNEMGLSSATIPVNEYVLLSRYFKSAALPTLQAMAEGGERLP